MIGLQNMTIFLLDDKLRQSCQMYIIFQVNQPHKAEGNPSRHKLSCTGVSEPT